MPENVTFSKTMQPPSEEKCWQTRPKQHRSPNSDSSQTLLGTVYNKRNVKMQNKSTRKSRKGPKEGPCTHWKRINQFRAGSILWMKQSDKKVSFKDPQNGGHVSCRKPVPHLRTSTVSDSEASIHLAHVQHLWQSKLFVIFLVWSRWRIRLCSELQLARQWLHMHFVIHVCWKKNCYADELWQQTFFQILHHVWTPKGSWKMDPKMVPEFDPQNGVQKWRPKMGSKNGTPKCGPKMAPKRGPNISIKKKSRLYLHFNTFFGCHFWTPFWGAIFGPHFGGQILAPFLGPFFNSLFGVQNMVQNLQKCLLLSSSA